MRLITRPSLFLTPILVALVVTVGLLIPGQTTLAGGSYFSVGAGYHNGYGGHRHGYRYHGYKSHGHYGRRYGYAHRPHRPYKPRGYYHYGYRGYDSGDLAAAAFVGGLIGYGISSYRYRHPRTYYSGNNTYTTYLPSGTSIVQRQTVPQSPPARTLFRDRHGECFEIRRNNYGDELRIQLDRSECSW